MCAFGTNVLHIIAGNRIDTYILASQRSTGVHSNDAASAGMPKIMGIRTPALEPLVR